MKKVVMYLLMSLSLFCFLGFANWEETVSSASGWGWWGGWGWWYSFTTSHSTTSHSTISHSIVTETKYYSWTWKIVVNPWETKVISFPQELSEIHFSKTKHFSIMTLEWWDWSFVWWWVENYIPLKWYWVYNEQWDPLVITYKVKPNIDWTKRMLQRRLYAWWNLIWISQPWVNKYYYKTEALWNLSFGQIIDFSNSKFWTTKNDSFNPEFSVKSYTNGFYLWEWLWYGIFLSNNSYLGWVQDITSETGAIVVSETHVVQNDNEDNTGNNTGNNTTDRTTTCTETINNYWIKYKVLENWAEKYYYPWKKNAKIFAIQFETTWDHKRTSGFSGLALTKIWFKLSNISDDEFSGEFLKNIRLVYSWDTIWTGILDLTGKTIIFSGLNYVFETTWNDIQLDLHADIDKNALNTERNRTYNFGISYSKSSPVYTTFEENNEVVVWQKTYTSTSWRCSSKWTTDIGDILWSILGGWYNWSITIWNPSLTLVSRLSTSKDVIWWETWVVLNEFTLRASYDDVLITSLFFANFNWSDIYPSLTENVISNVKIVDDSWNVYWNCEVWWGKIACINLTWLIINKNEDKTIKLVADFASITDASQPDIFRIYLTDIVAKWKESWITLKKLWGYNINRTYHFDEKTKCSITIRYRKAFLYFSGLDLPTTELKEGENIVYKVATKVKGEKVEIWQLRFHMKWIIWWTKIATPLILSWNKLLLKDNNLNTYGIILELNWIRYNSTVLSWKWYNWYCRQDDCDFRYIFSSWNILTWDWILEIILSFPKIIKNDYFVLNASIWWDYSDLSSQNHTEFNTSDRSSDRFNFDIPKWSYLAFDLFWKPELKVDTVQTDYKTDYLIVWTNDNKVAEFNFTADDGDVVLSWLRVNLCDSVSCILNSIEWYDKSYDLSYVKLVKLYNENNNLLATWTLNNSGYVDFVNLNYNISKDETKKLIIKIDTQTWTNLLSWNILNVWIEDIVAYSSWNVVKSVNSKYVDEKLWWSDVSTLWLTYNIEYQPVKSLITISSENLSASLVNGEQTIYKLNATADSAGSVYLKKFTLDLNWTLSGDSENFMNYITWYKIYVNDLELENTGYNYTLSGNTVIFEFTGDYKTWYEITAWSTVNFDVRTTISNVVENDHLSIKLLEDWIFTSWTWSNKIEANTIWSDWIKYFNWYKTVNTNSVLLSK